MGKHLLSKSSFIKGIQCEKQLFLYKYHYDWMDKVSENLQAVFKRGTDVGVLAQELFPGGKIATDDPKKSDAAINKTSKLIDENTEVIYEAAFLFDGILVISDIIVKIGNKWKIYEVKSSTSISDTYLIDAAVQYYVLSNSSIEIEDISIIYINNQYVRSGELDIHSLFNIESVMNLIIPKQEFIEKETSRLKEVLLRKNIPGIPIGTQCFDPYACSFFSHCWENVPDYSVFDIANLNIKKKFEFYNNGIVNLEDIPEANDLNDNQRMQVESHISNKTIIKMKEIKQFLNTIKYPIYFMDFETFMPAVPLFNNARPYQQIPFQYSLHFQKKSGSRLEHHEFLAEANGDPRDEFITKLLKDTKDIGTILVYNKSFEISRLKEIAKDFPEFAYEIEERISRIVDLMIPFQKRYYYKPAMKGSYSIKKVLPALIPELKYDDLGIKEGGTASSAFESLYYESDLFKIEEIRNNLLNYCKMDTQAMVEIFNDLINLL